MKSLKPTDQVEIEIPSFRSPDFRPWFAMVMSTVAVILSVIGFVHGQDDGEARAAYEAQSKSVQELSLQVQALSLEIAILRGYAEGQSKSITVAVPVKPGSSATPAGAFSVQVPIHLIPVKDVKPDEWSAPVPAPHPTMKPVTMPPFESLGKDEKKDEKK
jgi:hypothetical protein